MKSRTIALLVSLLLAAPVSAGPLCELCDCGEPDTDGDFICDIIDNCTMVANGNQRDGDQDGFGDACDCDFSPSANGVCDIGDFGSFTAWFGTGVPPTNCEFDIAPNGVVDVGDFGAFVSMFGGLPSPACGNPPGVACASVGTPCP
jgi:hypothetical protein